MSPWMIRPETAPCVRIEKFVDLFSSSSEREYGSSACGCGRRHDPGEVYNPLPRRHLNPFRERLTAFPPPPIINTPPYSFTTMFRLFKLFTLFFALLCVGTLAAPLDGSTTSSLRQNRGLERRQTIVQGTVCANVPVRITLGLGTTYVSPHIDETSGASRLIRFDSTDFGQRYLLVYRSWCPRTSLPLPFRFGGRVDLFP